MDLPEPPPFGPGLHRCSDAQPLVRAQELADQLDGRLCTTANDADVLLADLATVPPLEPDALKALGTLADRVQTAQRIADRTLDRTAEAVGERLAAGTGMAVHPTAVRARAARVTAAREAATEAEELLRVGEAEHERVSAETTARPAPDELLPVPAPVAATVDERPARRRWFRRNRSHGAEDTNESTDLLRLVVVTAEEAFGARRVDVARRQVQLLRTQRDRATEEVRVAERAWRDLAGDDPVEGVEAVVRRFDPQHQDALEVARDTVGVRAVSALLSRALDRWTEGWESLGFDEPAVAPDAMGAAVQRGTAAVVLTGEAVKRAKAIAQAAPAAPVLAVSPVSGREPARS